MLEAYERERDVAKVHWQSGLTSEVDFWDGWVASGYGGNAADFASLLDPNRRLDPEFTNLIVAAPGASVRVLDVGAGPLTALGSKWEGRNVTVRAVDPLADQYRSALEKKGVVPPTWTQRGDAEALSTLFPENEFDFVYATNCLDHSYDPLKAFTEIVRVLKPGCRALLRHAQNEAVAERYTGLHQWNFDTRDGEFILWRPGLTLFVHDALAEVARVDFTLTDYGPNRKWIYLRFQKLMLGEAPVKRTHSSLTETSLQTVAPVTPPVAELPAPPVAELPAPPVAELPLRYKAVDQLNDLLTQVPFLHRALKRLGKRFLG